MSRGGQCPLAWQGGAYNPMPPPGLAPLQHRGSAGLSVFSGDIPDLFFGACQTGGMAEPMKVVRGVGGGLVLQQQACQRKFVDSEDVDSHSTCTPPPDSIWSSPEDHPQQKGKKTRFCKAKRDRYRKLVERLVEEVQKNPNFDFEMADLPASFVLNAEAKAKLEATVMKFAKA